MLIEEELRDDNFKRIFGQAFFASVIHDGGFNKNFLLPLVYKFRKVHALSKML